MTSLEVPVAPARRAALQRNALFAPAGRSQVKLNAAANILGRGWSALLGFAFIPLYIRLLGIEAYGMIGFFSTLQAVFALLDMGLSTTLNREVARLSAQEATAPQQRDLVRTLEVVYWGAALLIAAVVTFAAPLIATHWITVERLPPHVVEQTLMMMGVVIAMQFPFTLYQGGLAGLQRQVLLNAIVVLGATLRFAGVVPVLLFKPTLVAFFGWQLLVSAIQTTLAAGLLWRVLPSGPMARFRSALLRNVWRFAAGMTGISITVVVLVQMDKVILSKLLPLERFGYYALASTIGGGLYMIISPLFTAVFPRFSQLIATGDERELAHLYHRASQAMAVILMPVALMVAVFAREGVLAWTRDANVAARTQWLVVLLTLGTALNGLMTVPYALQLASGWTRLTLVGNVVAIALLAPLNILLTHQYGEIGAAAVWVALNAGYVLISLQIMHRRLLVHELASWYRDDVGVPTLATIVTVFVARFVVPESVLVGKFALPVFALLGLAALMAASTSSSAGRQFLRSAVTRSRR
jgi:O-antigen/teichoic acid export membrane protein